MSLAILRRLRQRQPRVVLHTSAYPRSSSLRALRLLSTHGPPTGKNNTGSRVSTVFGALLCVGIVTTALGVYEFYSSFTTWPPELRGDLRAGLKAKRHGDLALSEKYLRRAWETAQTLPDTSLGPEPHLRLSGIGIALAGVLEDGAQPQRAYGVYGDVLARLLRARERQQGGGGERLGGRERMRVVAVAYKLGEMAGTYGQPREEEEGWLSVAVEELLSFVKDSRREKEEGGGGGGSEAAELDLPGWVSTTDIGAPLEALGAFYARNGNVEYAIPLYLQAISFLVPPQSDTSSSPEDRCRGAEIMNNLSDLIIRDSPSPEKLQQAEAWAQRALGVVRNTKEQASSKRLSTCEFALAAILFNLGSLREMADDRSSAREFFTASLEQSKAVKMKDGIVEAQGALRRLDRLERKSSNNDLAVPSND